MNVHINIHVQLTFTNTPLPRIYSLVINLEVAAHDVLGALMHSEMQISQHSTIARKGYVPQSFR
jgi:hypothetical protein